MKSPNKLVAPLLVGMLSVSSLYPGDSGDSGVVSTGEPVSDALLRPVVTAVVSKAAPGVLASVSNGAVSMWNRAAGSDAAKKTSNAMRRLCGSMKANPGKTEAALALVGSVALGCIAYKYRDSLYDLCNSCIDATVGYIYNRMMNKAGFDD